MTTRRSSTGATTRTSDGFTLVELLLVMTVIVAVVGVSAPTLANFFRGRTLDSEARRLLALTHGGQSRAVSEGVPMRLWVDVEQKTYGLDEQPGWDERDPKAVEFALDRDLSIEVIRSATGKSATSRNSLSGQPSAGNVSQADSRSLPQIRFLPDGSIEQTSPRALRLSDRNGVSVWIAQSRNGMSYEIRSHLE